MWEPMDTFPKDGTVCDILCKTIDEKNGTEVIAHKVKWAREAIGDNWGLYGEVNKLSSYLVPIGWRLAKLGFKGNTE